MPAVRRSYTITEAKDRLPSLVHEAERQPVRLTRRGKAVVVMLSAAEYDRLAEAQPNLSFLDRVRRFRENADLEALDPESAFCAPRDPSPGREFEWPK